MMKNPSIYCCYQGLRNYRCSRGCRIVATSIPTGTDSWCKNIEFRPDYLISNIPKSAECGSLWYDADSIISGIARSFSNMI